MQNTYSRNSRKNTAISIVRIAAVILFLGALTLLFSPRASAQPANPDSACVITDIHVNRNLIQNGDMLVTGQYDIPYATPPTMFASQTFFVELLNGSTQLGYIYPFVYFDNGYNTGDFSLYFTSSNAPTWGGTYTVEVAENPAQFSSPQGWSQAIPSSAWTSFTAQSDNQADLASQVISLAESLENIYGVQLITQSSAVVLTSETDPNDGEGYYRGAIPSLQAMAPSLFLIQTSPVNLNGTTWTTTKFDAYENRFNGTWVGTDIQNTATQFSMTPGLVTAVIITLPICLGFILFSSIKFKRAEPGYMVCALVLIMSVLMGWMPKAIFASIYQLCGIYVAYLWFFARS